jgi:amidohydrolase
MNYLPEANALRAELVAVRRDLHAHPELAFAEMRTAGIVANTLRELGFEVQTGVGKTGVIGVLDGGEPGPETLLLRFDMDALPIDEQVDVDFKSGTPNTMHACGHDAHTSIGLGVARLLARHRDDWRGTVKFVFQPAEEIGAGAAAMIADGALRNPTPTRTLSLHVWSTLPVGMLAITPGPLLAAIDHFHITLRGRGAHGASPQHGADPIVAAAQVIAAINTIVSRNIDPLAQGVISVGTVRAGSAPNIIPETVEIVGSMRAFEEPVMALLRARIETVAVETARGLGVNAEVWFLADGGLPPVVNDTALAQRVAAIARERFGVAAVRDDFRLMVSEDCAYFLRAAPGVFAIVGAGNSAAGIDAPHHSPRFQIDEDALPIGVALMCESAVALLNG